MEYLPELVDALGTRNDKDTEEDNIDCDINVDDKDLKFPSRNVSKFISQDHTFSNIQGCCITSFLWILCQRCKIFQSINITDNMQNCYRH